MEKSAIVFLRTRSHIYAFAAICHLLSDNLQSNFRARFTDRIDASSGADQGIATAVLVMEKIEAGPGRVFQTDATARYFPYTHEDNGMTREVDTDSFRESWEKRSPGWKYEDATSSSKPVGKPIDDARYAELQTRIRRLHEQFDAWCGDTEEGVFAPDEHDINAIER